MHRRVFAQNNTISCGYRDRKQAELFNVDHGCSIFFYYFIALHCIAEVRKEWRGCVYRGCFLPLGLGANASFMQLCSENDWARGHDLFLHDLSRLQ